MSKVRVPLFSVSARGKVGEVVYRKWRDQFTVSGRIEGPGNPQKPNMDQCILAAQSWGVLDEENRVAWIRYAQGGHKYPGREDGVNLAGFNYYCAMYTWAKAVGETPIVLPPDSEFPGPVVGFAVAQEVGSPDILISWSPVQEAEYVFLERTDAINPGRTLFDRNFENWQPIASGDGGVEDPGKTVGKKYGVRVSLVRANGQRGVRLEKAIIIS